MRTRIPTILITRPQPLASSSALALQKTGWDTIVHPLLDIVPLAVEFPSFQKCDGLAFTSVNGLAALMQNGQSIPQELLDKPCFCVGPATMDMASAHGFGECYNADGNVEDLANLLNARTSDGAEIWHICAQITAGKLATLTPELVILQLSSYRADAIMKIDQAVIEKIADDMIWGITFYSARTAQAFCSCVAAQQINVENLHAVCLSHNVAKPLLDLPFCSILEAAFPREAAMLATLEVARP